MVTIPGWVVVALSVLGVFTALCVWLAGFTAGVHHERETRMAQLRGVRDGLKGLSGVDASGKLMWQDRDAGGDGG